MRKNLRVKTGKAIDETYRISFKFNRSTYYGFKGDTLKAAVDDDVFAMTLMYVKGLRGGPLERLRESARERNFGKGKSAERARHLLRELADAGGES